MNNSPTTINLTATYNYVPPSVAIYDRLAAFPGRNKTSKASLFWGEEALALYWSELTDTYTRAFMNASVSGAYTYTKAALYLTPSESGIRDITSTGFFGGTELLISMTEDEKSLCRSIAGQVTRRN